MSLGIPPSISNRHSSPQKHQLLKRIIEKHGEELRLRVTGTCHCPLASIKSRSAAEFRVAPGFGSIPIWTKIHIFIPQKRTTVPSRKLRWITKNGGFGKSWLLSQDGYFGYLRYILGEYMKIKHTEKEMPGMKIFAIITSCFFQWAILAYQRPKPEKSLTQKKKLQL